MKKYSSEGFTLVELMIVTAILATVIVGMAQLFIYTTALAEMTGNVTIAVNEAQSKIEEIRNHNFDDITTDYSSTGSPGNVFDLEDLTGKGYVNISTTNNSELLIVEVSACWRDKYNRVVGEDTNLDGTLSLSTEDLDGDGKVSSPARVMTMITRR